MVAGSVFGLQHKKHPYDGGDGGWLVEQRRETNGKTKAD